MLEEEAHLAMTTAPGPLTPRIQAGSTRARGKGKGKGRGRGRGMTGTTTAAATGGELNGTCVAERILWIKSNLLSKNPSLICHVVVVDIVEYIIT